MGYMDFGPYKWTKPRMGVLPDEPSFDDLRLNWAVQAIQRRLLASEFDPHRLDGVFGYWTMRATKQFQRDRGLPVDGEVGRKTLEELLRQLILRKSRYYDLPDWSLAGMVTQESGFDVGATGAFTSTGVDRGLVQINSVAHPDVSDEEAFNPRFALEWSGERLRNAYERFVSDKDLASFENEDLSWSCAVASHNSPADAMVWAKTGTPPDEQIQNYVAKIRQYGESYWS